MEDALGKGLASTKGKEEEDVDVDDEKDAGAGHLVISFLRGGRR